MGFPTNFVWGAGASAYQVEGGSGPAERGRSVWDIFSQQPGKVIGDENGLLACDHYGRYEEDVALMRQMSLQAYRFSVSWPRVLPEGVGQVNEAGLDFYDRLVDRLLEAGIDPWLTLFHWDYPYELHCRGGWLNSASSDWFAEYTALIVDRLGDRVTNWITLNEPQCFVGLGYEAGTHAPGERHDWPALLRIGHNVLLAHGKATQIIRARAATPPHVGFAPVAMAAAPASETSQDIEAAYNFMFGLRHKTTWNTTWWADPVLRGHYPEDGLRLFGEAVPKYTQAEMDTICQPLDFYGMNLYSGDLIRAGQDGQPEQVKVAPGYPKTLFQWDVRPESLYWAIRFFHERYGLPVVVTENGMSNPDWVALDGQVHDPQRIDYLTRYIGQVERAIADGAQMLGYFHWSLMDNFEWAEGYRQRFGLIYVDFPTQKRIWKDSAHWYSQLIQTNGGLLTASQPVLA